MSILGELAHWLGEGLLFVFLTFLSIQIVGGLWLHWQCENSNNKR